MTTATLAPTMTKLVADRDAFLRTAPQSHEIVLSESQETVSTWQRTETGYALASGKAETDDHRCLPEAPAQFGWKVIEDSFCRTVGFNLMPNNAIVRGLLINKIKAARIAKTFGVEEVMVEDAADRARSQEVVIGEPEIRHHHHDWDQPIEVVGGCAENPGSFGGSGSVIERFVCMRCGAGRTTVTYNAGRGNDTDRTTTGQYTEALLSHIFWSKVVDMAIDEKGDITRWTKERDQRLTFRSSQGEAVTLPQIPGGCAWQRIRGEEYRLVLVG